MQKMVEKGLKPSRLIYDRLVHYQTLVPMNREDFIKHAKIVNPKGLNEGKSPEFAEGWYFAWMSKYDESHGAAAQAALKEIIDTYFPKGRP